MSDTKNTLEQGLKNIIVDIVSNGDNLSEDDFNPDYLQQKVNEIKKLFASRPLLAPARPHGKTMWILEAIIKKIKFCYFASDYVVLGISEEEYRKVFLKNETHFNGAEFSQIIFDQEISL